MDTGAVHKRGNLGTEVRSCDKCSEDVLWKHVGERTCVVADTVVGDVDVLEGEAVSAPRRSRGHVSWTGRSESPNYVMVDGDCLRLEGGSLALCFGRLFKGARPLASLRWHGDLLTEDDFADSACSGLTPFRFPKSCGRAARTRG